MAHLAAQAAQAERKVKEKASLPEMARSSVWRSAPLQTPSRLKRLALKPLGPSAGLKWSTSLLRLPGPSVRPRRAPCCPPILGFLRLARRLSQPCRPAESLLLLRPWQSPYSCCARNRVLTLAGKGPCPSAPAAESLLLRRAGSCCARQQPRARPLLLLAVLTPSRWGYGALETYWEPSEGYPARPLGTLDYRADHVNPGRPQIMTSASGNKPLQRFACFAQMRLQAGELC